MKSLLIIVHCLLISSGIIAQTYITQVKSADEKLWGYINQDGETVIPSIYKKCYPFAENGLAAIYESKEYKIINTKGIEIATEITGFMLDKGFIGFGGLQGYYDDMLAVLKDKKWGFLNSEGKLVIELKYDKVSIFNNGYSTAQRGDNFYIVNKSGEETMIEDAALYEVKRFSEGLAPFTNDKKESGFINTNGKVIIQAEFLTVGYFVAGLAWAKTSDKKVGFIDKTGEWVINPQFEAAKKFDPVSGLARVKLDGNWAYVNKSGTVVYIDDTEKWGHFKDGLAKGKKDGKTGYYNKIGEWVIPPTFDGGRDFINGFIAVKMGGEWGFIDKSGKWVIEPQYVSVKDMEKVK